MDHVLCGLDVPQDPNILAGLAGSEDAGVYRLRDDLAIVNTIDFFTPIVDDPRTFGRAAATNSLSDVYAMGGRPVTAMNVVCFPSKKLGHEVLREILAGGLDILREAGVALVGGHSVEDDEPKYGLAVTGIIHPDRIMTNAGLQPGDALILTKPIGTGIIATAVKGRLASSEAVDAMIQSMTTLNRAASEVAVRFNVRACTDITGFGLAGHLVEMVRASRCRARINARAVPILKDAEDYASMGLIPAGAHGNRKFFGTWITVDSTVPLVRADLVFDPQTSGGLILGIPAPRAENVLTALRVEGVDHATLIGEVLEPHPEGLLEIV